MSEAEKGKVVTFRAPPALFNEIISKSELLFGGNKTKYIAYKLTHNGNSSVPINDINIEKIDLHKLIKEVNKIGNNVNQIARRTNLGFRKDEPLKVSLKETQNKMDELISLMNKIIQSNNPNFK